MTRAKVAWQWQWQPGRSSLAAWGTYTMLVGGVDGVTSPEMAYYVPSTVYHSLTFDTTPYSIHSLHSYVVHSIRSITP